MSPSKCTTSSWSVFLDILLTMQTHQMGPKTKTSSVSTLIILLFTYYSFYFCPTATGKLSSFLQSGWALASWCTRWHPPCVTRYTCMVSGPSAGTPTQARSCPIIILTRRAPSLPPNGRSPTSSLPSSNSCIRCTQRDCWSSPSHTVPKGPLPHFFIVLTRQDLRDKTQSR